MYVRMLKSDSARRKSTCSKRATLPCSVYGRRSNSGARRRIPFSAVREISSRLTRSVIQRNGIIKSYRN